MSIVSLERELAVLESELAFEGKNEQLETDIRCVKQRLLEENYFSRVQPGLSVDRLHKLEAETRHVEIEIENMARAIAAIRGVKIPSQYVFERYYQTTYGVPVTSITAQFTWSTQSGDEHFHISFPVSYLDEPGYKTIETDMAEDERLKKAAVLETIRIEKERDKLAKDRQEFERLKAVFGE